MKNMKQVPFGVIIQAWLKAEWHHPSFDPVRRFIPQSLIDDENDNSQQNHELRYWLLRTLRSPMLDTLPEGLVWYSTSYEMIDVDRTFIVPSPDWGPVSGGQFRPAAVLPNVNGDDPHAIKIRGIKETLSSIDRRLILVASDVSSVLTIIEGNHRGVAILADAVENGAHDPLIEEVFVGVSPSMRNYHWHIEQHLRPQTSVRY